MRSRPRRVFRALSFLSIAVALAILTGWNLTRSEALAAAERSYARVDLLGCLGHALDHLERRPWSREAALLAARCLSRLDYPEQAEAYYRRAGRLSPPDLQIRAFGLVRGPHPERSIPIFDEILRLEPNNVTAMRRLAAILLAQNDKAGLIALADRLDRVPGGEVIGAMLRGTVYHNEQNPQMAVGSFERVLELDPGLREMPASRTLFWRQLVDDLVECGRMDDAGRYLEKALALGPDAHLMSQLGYSHFLRGDLEQAERCYRQSIEMDATYFGSHLNLAKLALQRRRPEEALRELNQARRLAPQQYGVLYSLSLIYRQLGQTAAADEVQEQIRQLKEMAAGAAKTPSPSWPRHAL